MRAHDLRLLGPAAATWAAAWLATGATDAAVPAWSAPLALWGLAGLAVVVVVGTGIRAFDRNDARRRPPVRATLRALGAPILVAAACGALAATVAGTALATREGSALTDAAGTRAPTELTARLESALRPASTAPWDDGASMRARAVLVAVDGRPVPSVPLEVVLPVEDAAARASAGFGSVVTVEGRVAAAPGTERFAFRVHASEVTAVAPAPWFIAWTHPLRAGLAEAAEQLGGDGGALVPGLAIGDTSRLPDDLDAAMTTASLTHLTAVSGANCALVTAAAFWLAGLLGMPRSARVVAALLALVGFVLLVTPESSVVRAAAMAVVVLVACATGRAGGGASALSVATIVLLVADPWYARDFGFALSVCATAGLVLGSGPLAGGLARWMPRPVAVVLAVPLAAQLACQPVLVLLDPVVATYGLPANLLAAPAAPIATMAGLAGCLLLPVLPSAGFAALQLAWLPASWIALLARGVDAMPFTGLPWVPDAGGAMLSAIGIAAGVVLAATRSTRRTRAGAVRIGAAVVLCLSIAVPLGATVGRPAIAQASRPDDWRVLQCDIGQGDAVLVREGDATMLVDTGVEPEPLADCLALAGVDRIDLAVITHWDADHAGGVEAIAGRVDVVLHGPLDGTRSDRAIGPLARGGAELVQVGDGATGRLGRAVWQVLWPPARAEPGNDASVVLELRTDDYRAVFLGDLGAEAQAALLREHEIGRVDLVKVAHHGSRDQDPALYRELAASVGLIGVGADNGYGHPTASLLGLLADAETVPVRSDVSGTAALTVDDGRFRLWAERGDDRADGVAGPP